MGHRKGDPRPDQQIQTEPGENARIVEMAQRYMENAKCDMTDPEAVVDRYNWYLSRCIEFDDKPSVAGMALAFGYSRMHLLRIKNGEIKSVPEEVSDTLKRAWDALEYALNKYMMDGKINPIPALFLLKNNHGYKDQSEQIVIHRDPYDTGNPEEIARKYLSGVAPALDAPQENAPIVETVVIDQTGTVE